ncbi:allatostatin [Pectinophora gossypiella]|uniref:allatostatin n=1 Tax=Pectinophora gossypiella TaxID=13191 RepID=UPI00214F21E4|nr:allatostatin [Pectinophora gossypiella]
MKASAYNTTAIMLLLGSFAVLLLTASAAPVESDDEQSENTLVARPDEDYGTWDPANTAALRKLLLQLDAEDRMSRVSRSWPAAEPRGWGLRALDARLARPWRADKRQVRFRQCYFNPISCFRK